MIRFISNGITDQLGRSNFVDSNGMCIGFKEFPDGNPILWTAIPFEKYHHGDTSTFPEQSEFSGEKSLREFLDGSEYIFGYAGVERSPHDESLEVAKIHLLSYKKEDVVLFVLISKAENIYFADFKIGVEDRKKLFGNYDTLATAISRIRNDVFGVLKDLNALQDVVRALCIQKKDNDK